MTAYLVTCVFTFIPIHFLSSKISIKTIYSASLLFMSIVLPFMYLVGIYKGEISKLTLGLILVGLAGIPQAALYVFAGPLLGQVVDYDEIFLTGKRREAIYSGATGFITKLAMTFSSVIMWFLFKNFGYSHSNPLGIFLVGPTCGIIAFLGFLIFLHYPLRETPKKGKDYSGKIRERESGEISNS
jgi:Na+/melibiose symporter-like transporter